MPERHKGDRGALWALGMALGTIAFLKIFDDKAGRKKGQKDENERNGEQGQDGFDGYSVLGMDLSDPQWVSALASVAAVLISAIAVFLLYRTLSATRTAIDQAADATAAAQDSNRLMHEGQRAWVSLEVWKTENQHILKGSDGMSIPAEFRIKNIGQSIAFDAQIWMAAIDASGPGGFPDLCIDMIKKVLSEDETEIRAATAGIGPLIPGEEHLGAFSLRIQNEDSKTTKPGHMFTPEVHVCVRYRLSGDGDPKYISKVFSITNPEKDKLQRQASWVPERAGAQDLEIVPREYGSTRAI